MFGSFGLLVERGIRNALILADDVTALAKPVVLKAAGVVVDDTTVGADQVNSGGIQQHRETALVGKVMLASFANKIILAGALLAIEALAPIVPALGLLPELLLGLGASYLVYEGAHKVLHTALYIPHLIAQKWRGTEHHAPTTTETTTFSAFDDKMQNWSQQNNLLGRAMRFLGHDKTERRTLLNLATIDTVLSTEIMLISFAGLATGVSLAMKATVLGIVAAATTGGVYTTVLGIVRADNLAAALQQHKNQISQKTGHFILQAMPSVMNIISAVGTIAMLGVGGGILAHLIPTALSAEGLTGTATTLQHLATALENNLPFAAANETLASAFIGTAAGLILMPIINTASKLKEKFRTTKQPRAITKPNPSLTISPYRHIPEPSMEPTPQPRPDMRKAWTYSKQMLSKLRRPLQRRQPPTTPHL